jgi:hypothetical protein
MVVSGHLISATFHLGRVLCHGGGTLARSGERDARVDGLSACVGAKHPSKRAPDFD